LPSLRIDVPENHITTSKKMLGTPKKTIQIMASMEQAMLSSQEIDGNYYEVQTSNQLSLFNLGQT